MSLIELQWQWVLTWPKLKRKRKESDKLGELREKERENWPHIGPHGQIED